ncbi:hypothetical protein ON05_031575 (plasmid) [Acaryochloris sp. CCMEE 5410]|nr:hypothetical protein ON05_031575 [Acaryochloris sp. CCMEE 5410]
MESHDSITTQQNNRDLTSWRHRLRVRPLTSEIGKQMKYLVEFDLARDTYVASLGDKIALFHRYRQGSFSDLFAIRNLTIQTTIPIKTIKSEPRIAGLGISIIALSGILLLSNSVGSYKNLLQYSAVPLSAAIGLTAMKTYQKRLCGQSEASIIQEQGLMRNIHELLVKLSRVQEEITARAQSLSEWQELEQSTKTIDGHGPNVANIEKAIALIQQQQHSAEILKDKYDQQIKLWWLELQASRLSDELPVDLIQVETTRQHEIAELEDSYHLLALQQNFHAETDNQQNLST